MKSKFYREAFILGALEILVSVPLRNAQQSSAGNVLDSIAHAKEAVEHGKQGHADMVMQRDG